MLALSNAIRKRARRANEEAPVAKADLLKRRTRKSIRRKLKNPNIRRSEDIVTQTPHVDDAH